MPGKPAGPLRGPLAADAGRVVRSTLVGMFCSVGRASGIFAGCGGSCVLTPCMPAFSGSGDDPFDPFECGFEGGIC